MIGLVIFIVVMGGFIAVCVAGTYLLWLMQPLKSQTKYDKIMNFYTFSGQWLKAPYVFLFLVYPILFSLISKIGPKKDIMQMHTHDSIVRLYQTVASIGAPIAIGCLDVILVSLGLQLILLLTFGHDKFKQYQQAVKSVKPATNKN